MKEKFRNFHSKNQKFSWNFLRKVAKIIEKWGEKIIQIKVQKTKTFSNSKLIFHKCRFNGNLSPHVLRQNGKCGKFINPQKTQKNQHKICWRNINFNFEKCFVRIIWIYDQVKFGTKKHHEKIVNFTLSSVFRFY